MTPAANAAINVCLNGSPGGRRRPRQREREDLRPGRCAQEAAATGGDDDVLAAVLAEKRHRRGVRAGGQLGLPQLLPGPRLEGAETAVDRRADEDDAAGR